MAFEDIVAVIGRAFGTELAIVQGTTAFEVGGGDDGDRIRVLIQDESERNRVLLSADLGEPPPEGGERLFRTMLEANNLFSGTAGATLALDATAGRFRLQMAEPPDEFANDAARRIGSFIQTAFVWQRAIADFRPAAGDGESGGAGEAGGGFGLLPV